MLSPKPWKIESLLQMLAGIFGGVTLFGLLTAALGYQPSPDRIDHTMLLVGSISFPGMGVFWLHWLVRDHGLTWPEALGLRSRSFVWTILLGSAVGLAAYFFCVGLANWVAQSMSQHDLLPEAQSSVQALQTSVSPAWVAAYAAISITIAPLVEEFLFRGLLYGMLKQAGFRVTAWVVSSLLFAGIHVNLQAFLPLTVLALLLTGIYEWTDSLIAPITAHAVFNAINFSVALRYGAL